MNQSASANVNTAPEPAMKAIAASAGTLSPPFNPRFKRYTLLVDHATESVRLTIDTGGDPLTLDGVPAVPGQPSDPIALQPGRNVVSVVITSPDGQRSKSHQVVIRRAHETPDWRQVIDQAPWPVRDSAGELVFNGQMWLFGGYTPKVINDVWRSRDGRQWEQMPSIPDPRVNIPLRFVFNNQMWLTSDNGGYFRSSDGQSWERITQPIPWLPRIAAGSVVFNGRMWIIGGIHKGKRCNDVWSSDDGLNWRLETPAAPWSPRHLHDNVVAHNGRLWVIGGGIQDYHPFRAYQDVWSSTDGKNWELVTDQAPWPARYWASTTVYRGRLWLFAGFRSEPRWENLADAWHSVDGVHWRKLETAHHWTPRHEVSPYVFDDKLWIVAGNAWPLTNDVWSLHIPGLCFTTSPVVEEYANAMYAYHAQADFNASCKPVRYRLIEHPAWLNLADAQRGLLRGITPDAAGEHHVTIEAYDEAGETARQSFTIHVL